MIPVQYSARSLIARRMTTVLCVAGMALVAFILAGVLMLASGVEATLRRTGTPENALVLRQGATSEIVSQLDKPAARLVAALPGIATAPDGTPLAAPELVALVNLPRAGAGERVGNITVRGVVRASFAVREEVRVIQGRPPRPGTSEVLVGRGLAGRTAGAELGGALRFGRRTWPVVGIFAAGGSAFESEIWADADQLAAALQRPAWSSLTARLRPDAPLSALQEAIAADPRLQLEAREQRAYYENLSRGLATFIRVLGLFVTVVFSAGAVLGAAITMFAQVAHRTREIGILRALGFSRAAVLLAFVGESAALGLMAGALGVGAASLLGLATFTTINFQSFSQVTFRFDFTWPIAMATMGFAVGMGTLGGAWPALRAARRPIVQAARAL